jgi:hypothetical protein
MVTVNLPTPPDQTVSRRIYTCSEDGAPELIAEVPVYDEHGERINSVELPIPAPSGKPLLTFG